MSAHLRLWAASVRRIVAQLSHDHRTVAIVLVVPLVLLTLLHEIYADDARLANRVETQMLAVFPVFIMFLLTAVAMVRERTSGTLERLLTTRLGKADLLLAYGAGFGLLAAAQAAAMTAFCTFVLGTDFAGPLGYVLLVSAVTALLGVSLGLLASAVSRSEFQAVQMFPVLVVPQILLCGLLGARENMADWLHALSTWLPLTYSIEALGEVSASSDVSADYWRYVAILAGCVVGLLILASTTLRRRTA
jgi:ABC-2 type transport system permease protein